LHKRDGRVLVAIDLVDEHVELSVARRDNGAPKATAMAVDEIHAFSHPAPLHRRRVLALRAAERDNVTRLSVGR
jgi:hypothetical protein